MTGPEHYREAERLIEPGDGDVHELEMLKADVAIAQVHATLALAAATALNDSSVGMSGRDHGAWLQAAATLRPVDPAVTP